MRRDAEMQVWTSTEDFKDFQENQSWCGHLNEKKKQMTNLKYRTAINTLF